jgi:hypothetical protein
VSAGQSDFNILLLVLPLGSWRFLFPFLLGGGTVFSLFLLLYHISNGNRRKKQTAPSTASGKRKCDDTNSTYEHTNIPQTTKQHNTCLQTALVFFLRVLFFFVFCSFTAAWNGKAAYIGIEGRRKESALEVETGQTEGERNQVVTPLALVGSLSRVRPSCWK